MFDKLHEECGVFGIYSLDGQDVSNDIYYGLNALQHRGQESCGIALCDTHSSFGNVLQHKGMGLVNEVFSRDTLDNLYGDIGIGHVRYSTAGASSIENAQPLVLKYSKGTLSLAHNGNLTNANELKKDLENQGAIFHTTTDSEVIATMIAKERTRVATVEEAIINTAALFKGGYALVIASPRKLVGVRDPFGLKPLCLGKKGETYILASEDCALYSVGAEFIRDIEPGEIISITNDGISSNRDLVQEKKAHCIFEYIYFARLDSTLDNISVYNARVNGGRALYKSSPVKADLVTGVPDSGLAAAIGYAKESGIPFSLVFHKNTYIGRTFIKPTQAERESAVAMKLSVLSDAVKGKSIVLIDDSIVRGTTIASLIKSLKEAGAKDVHVRISSPPFLYPCYYGTDVPTGDQLIAHSYTPEQICDEIGADSLSYMRLEDFKEMVGDLPICTACFNKQYPV